MNRKELLALAERGKIHGPDKNGNTVWNPLSTDELDALARAVKRLVEAGNAMASLLRETTPTHYQEQYLAHNCQNAIAAWDAALEARDDAE